MKRVLALLAVCALAVSPLGFVGCGNTIEEDPDAKANEAKQNEFSGDAHHYHLKSDSEHNSGQNQ